MKVPTPVTDPNRFLRVLDDPNIQLLVRLQDQLLHVSADFWRRRKALNIHLPITTSSISSPMGLGSDSSPVAIEMFGQHTYLADSMQFLLEYGCRIAPEGAWYLMPSFRGEEADKTHLNQFFHSEAEIRGSLKDVQKVVADYILALSKAALEEFSTEIAAAAGTLDHIESMIDIGSIPEMTLDQAVEHLGEASPCVVHDPAGFRTITREGEHRLMNEISPILWVTHFDQMSVPFYQADEPGTDKARNADLLFGMGEIVGAGERHVDGEQTRKALAHRQVAEQDYDWYVRMKTERPLLTSGFGLGVERWLMWLLRHDDIRDLQLVPRLNGIALAP
ncbi:asparaginyl-tRNA synthetase [Arthrobacter sp. AG258]|uniref:amino acid--tRNA ligase-related protein n=1 Tax=Arthrobacter sp. AG258 TaxID=2183899 RepID=UPI0010E8C633|nr:amino acid--tRNA ligase-related protein [Arthrobacter sp. AG258]TDT81859.1 asparaginyl-tRNA synthetase [Arthrobacter sp. AG258]